jgi:hypothetical protein
MILYFSSTFRHHQAIEFGRKMNHFIFILRLVYFLRVGFSEMPSLNIKVVPTYGENQYDYTLLQDFLEARIRAELKVSKIFLKNIYFNFVFCFSSDLLSYQLWMINFYHSSEIGLSISCKSSN